MGTKSCAVWYRQSRNQTDAMASYTKLRMQEQYHGQPHGIWAADECFGGRDLNRGIELCAVVEQMYSLQHMFRVQGDPAFLDKCERIAYNALPATITPDMWKHQYLQQANEINALYGIRDHVWQTDGADSTGFGVAPNFGCEPTALELCVSPGCCSLRSAVPGWQVARPTCSRAGQSSSTTSCSSRALRTMCPRLRWRFSLLSRRW
jgi:hypothetical protein